jgi:hypothetical protein
MPVRSTAVPVLVLILALASPAAAAPPGGKIKYPSKSGIYAMTSDGPVELKVSGEPNDVIGALGLQCFYSDDAFDKIPRADWVRSFYVSAMGWAARRVYMVAGREGLTNPLANYQLLSGSVQSRGVVAFEVVSADLQSLAWIRQAIRKLVPASVPDADVEAYLVLELKSTSGLSNRHYPVRISVPPQ